MRREGEARRREREAERAAREEARARAQAEREDKERRRKGERAVMLKRTRRGQPVMKYRIDKILGQLGGAH